MTKPRRVTVVVLGDLARSPRMRNHARELIHHGFAVTSIGYTVKPLDPFPGETILPLHPIDRGQSPTASLAYAVRAALRMILLFWELLYRLAQSKPRHVLVQNPPNFPTVLAAALVTRLGGATLLIDWHNYGYTLLAGNRWLARLARWQEFASAALARRHFTVSRALAHSLDRDAIVLPDLPLHLPTSQPQRTIWICPTGWTADEDLALLFDALSTLVPGTYHLHITGDGPLRASFAPRIEALRALGHRIDCGYWPAAEYQRLLGQSALGLSLHRSTSGLDLAMKVIDLFTHCVPVCALDYGSCIAEQIDSGDTGLLFHTAVELASLLRSILDQPAQLSRLRDNIARRYTTTWREAWATTALPHFDDFHAHSITLPGRPHS